MRVVAVTIRFRLAKTVRIGEARLRGMFEVYNPFNSSAGYPVCSSHEPANLP